MIAAIEAEDGEGYWAHMRLLALRLLMLVAVAIMPLGMAAPAQAQPMTHMAMSHCPEQKSHQQHKVALGECTMACASALPAIDRGSDDVRPVSRVALEPLPAHPLHGLHPDTATPPPKAS